MARAEPVDRGDHVVEATLDMKGPILRRGGGRSNAASIDGCDKLRRQRSSAHAQAGRRVGVAQATEPS